MADVTKINGYIIKDANAPHPSNAGSAGQVLKKTETGTEWADGEKGITPHIDETTKHWVIGNTDTGIIAEGKTSELTIGTVTSGIEASATITGEAPNQVLNLVLKQGEKGDSGVYVGAGDMPEGYNVQIDPSGSGDEIVTAENIESALGYTPADSADVADKLTAPPTAAVGQIFRVQSINEDGSLVLEAVDMPSGGAVDDVQINGTSIVTDGVANLPVADKIGKIGFARLADELGVKWSDANGGGLSIDYAKPNDIKVRSSSNKPLISYYLDDAVKAAMCDGKGAAWTAEEQAAARERMAVENGADFELLVDATLEEAANTFTVAFPKPVRECIYHIWFYNNNGASVIAQTYCIESDTSNYYLLRYVTVVDSRGYVLNGYFRHNGPINTRSIIGYAADSQAGNWTSDNPGNGNAAYMNYPTAKVLSKVDGLKFFLNDKTHLLNVGAKIQVWGR